MTEKSLLVFDSLRAFASSVFRQIPDKRQAGKTSYSIHDAMMSGFACMHFQDPSLLQFQRRMEDEEQKSNIQTLFDVEKIPKDTQIRDIIDKVPGEIFRPIFKAFINRLKKSHALDKFTFYKQTFLCSIDGTQYHSSDSISCNQCLKTTHKNHIITYSHKVLQAAIVKPGMSQVIPMMPEEIRNNDGIKKQDCEINAGKRLIPKIRKDHPHLPLTIAGDALYAAEPLISLLKENEMHYILGVKPDRHKFMFSWVDAYGHVSEKRFTDKKGKEYIFEWGRGVPLNANSYETKVNFIRFRIVSADGRKVNYSGSWITDFDVNESNVETLVKGARARWKIENECFNTLKNQGYCIEHNYGHGTENLCYNFLLLTILAFFFHQIFEATDSLYQTVREKFGSKRHMWEKLRSHIDVFVFSSWTRLLQFTLNPKSFTGGIRI